MKILLVNNNHFYKGGACRAYFDTIKILEEKGHEVAHFSTISKDNLPSPWSKHFVKQYDLANPGKYSIFRKIHIVGRIWYNFEARRKLRKLLADFRPDVAHLHNIYHHLSPSVIDELKKYKIPIVMTLHDFKLVCPNYDLFAHGDVYDRCKDGKYYQCVIDKCVKNSYLQSLVCAIEAYLHKLLKVYEKIDVLTAPSKFYGEKVREFGFHGMIEFLPNPIFETPEVEKDPDKLQGVKEQFFLFDGQLNEEKGTDDLLRAFARTNVEEELYILGDGPLRGKLINLAQKLGIKDKVKFFSFAATTQEQQDRMHKQATAVISPSRCYENAPYSVLKALGMGTVAIAHDQGGSREMIGSGERGYIYKKGDIQDLARAIEEAANDINKRSGIIEKGKKFIRENYSPEVFYISLMNIYHQARREVGNVNKL